MLKDKSKGIEVTLTDVANDQDRDYVHHQIRAFNDRASRHHREIRGVGPRPLDIILRNAAGEIVGGLTASTYWDWLDIDDLWLAEEMRGQGYGREVLRMAEEEARQRGCRRAKVQTFSFQARGFYEKMGYRVVGALEDYPPGGCFYWLRKEI
jgi:GNAT superfamily N-acetyltransferase